MTCDGGPVRTVLIACRHFTLRLRVFIYSQQHSFTLRSVICFLFRLALISVVLQFPQARSLARHTNGQYTQVFVTSRSKVSLHAFKTNANVPQSLSVYAKFADLLLCLQTLKGIIGSC